MMSKITPDSNDVLFGRGSLVNRHPGNVLLRSMIDERRDEFVHASSRKEKRAIAMEIISDYVEECDGRFLEEGGDAATDRSYEKVSGSPEAHNGAPQAHPNVSGKVWTEAEPEKVLSKVMHRLREKRERGSSANGGKKVDSSVNSSGDEGPGKSDADEKCSRSSEDNQAAAQALLSMGNETQETQGSAAEFNTRVTEKVLSKLLEQQQEIQRTQHVSQIMNAAAAASFLMPTLASTHYAAQAAAVAPSVALWGNLGNIHGQGCTEQQTYNAASNQAINRMAVGSLSSRALESSKTSQSSPNVHHAQEQHAGAGRKHRRQSDESAQSEQSKKKKKKSARKSTKESKNSKSM